MKFVLNDVAEVQSFFFLAGYDFLVEVKLVMEEEWEEFLQIGIGMQLMSHADE